MTEKDRTVTGILVQNILVRRIESFSGKLVPPKNGESKREQLRRKRVIQQKERVVRDNEQLMQTLLVCTEKMGGCWWVGLVGNTWVH